MISIVVPTVAGREHWLANCEASYAAHTGGRMYELIVVEDKPTCGEAWLEGADQARGDHIHFSADDLQPHAGWWQAAEQVVDLGLLPAPRILHPDGALQSCGGTDQWNNPHENPTGFLVDFSRIPFIERGQWEKIRPLAEAFLATGHYWTDDAVGRAAAAVGVRTTVHRGYLFTHHVAQEKRGAGMTERERMMLDHEAFLAWSQGLPSPIDS